jgi:hypothetical protein
MKKSKIVNLVLITAALATVEKAAAQDGASGDWDNQNERKVYMRSDTTAPYTLTHHHYHGSGIGNALLWYYAFRPYGSSGMFGYSRSGYYSGGLSERSNIGSNPMKSNIVRGGFGRSAFRAAS